MTAFAALVEEMDTLMEKTFSPFKRCKKIGTGPRGGDNAKVGQWDCSKQGKYVQKCIGKGPMKGRTKIVKIDPEYKSGYNAQYKPWEADGRPGSDCSPKGAAAKKFQTNKKSKGKERVKKALKSTTKSKAANKA